MTHRIPLALLLCLLTAAPALLALPPEGPGEARDAGRSGPGFLPPPGYLDLSDAQRDATVAILEQLQADVQPLRAERRILREEIRDELQSDAPSALAIGEATIALHALGSDIRSLAEAAEAEFALLLDAEQLTKWENFRELRELRRHQRRDDPEPPAE